MYTYEVCKDKYIHQASEILKPQKILRAPVNHRSSTSHGGGLAVVGGPARNGAMGGW